MERAAVYVEPSGGRWFARESRLWVAGMVAFTSLLFLAVGEILRSGRHPGVVAAGLTGVGVFVLVFAWFATAQPVGIRLERAWPLVLLAVIGVGLVFLTPSQGLFIGTVGALGGLYLAPRPAIGLIATMSGVAFVSKALDESLTDGIAHLAQTAAIGAFCFGWARLHEINAELQDAREELARLAVADERVRFARDMHDLLGHTLSVIRVKSELATRIVESDPDRASTEMGQVEALARSALTEVREAVSGYQPDLRAELRRARAVLRDAGIQPRVDCSAAIDHIDEAAGATLGWVLREATTNVLRHSRASCCRISVARDGTTVVLAVEDDGTGTSQVGEGGRGVRGMTERLAEIGGRLDLETRPGRGFRLRASVPVPPSGPVPP